MDKILILGASGYIGGKLISILVNKRNINDVVKNIKDLNIDFVKLEVNSHEN